MSSQPSTSIPTSGPTENSNPPTDQSPPFDPSSAAYDDDADPDINMTLDPSSSTIKQESPIGGFDGANEPQPTQNGEDPEGGIEAKLPMQKDISLQEFLGKMDEYAPIVRITSPLSVFMHVGSS